MDELAGQPGILASDAEREQSVAVLRDAVVDGRLTLEEFAERVDRAQVARTDRELAVLTNDLPRPSVEIAAIAEPSTPPARHVAVCSRIVRRGPWDLPRHSSFRAIFGTIDLDLREARLPGPEVDLEVFNLFGTVTVIVPDGVVVRVEGGGMFASQVVEAPASHPVAGAPVLRIRASGPGGTLYVRTREPASRLRRLLGAEAS